MKMLEVNNLSVRYGSHQVLKDVSFSLQEGEWLMLVGPNGAGKSTIVSAISQGIDYDGEMTCLGKNIRTYKPQELARQVGILAQNHYVGYSFTVREVVRLGRYAYNHGLFGKSDDQGETQIEKALELTGLTDLQDHSVLELSGGELQRVFLAQLFAQNPSILILDEPTNHLDLVYQKQVFALLQEWLREEHRGVISVVHDLSLARRYGSSAMLLHQGRCLCQGRVEEVFHPNYLSKAYDMDVYGWMREMLGQWEI